ERLDRHPVHAAVIRPAASPLRAVRGEQEAVRYGTETAVGPNLGGGARHLPLCLRVRPEYAVRFGPSRSEVTRIDLVVSAQLLILGGEVPPWQRPSTGEG